MFWKSANAYGEKEFQPLFTIGTVVLEHNLFDAFFAFLFAISKNGKKSGVIFIRMSAKSAYIGKKSFACSRGGLQMPETAFSK